MVEWDLDSFCGLISAMVLGFRGISREKVLRCGNTVNLLLPVW